MRYFIGLLIGTIALSACGGSSASSKPTSTPAPKVVTIPRTSPVPVKTIKGLPTPNPHATPIKLPTVKPISIPTPTAFPPSAYTARLHGVVTNAKSHRPLAGAVVAIGTAGGRRTLTSSSGQYSVPFPAGPYVVVRVDKKGYFESLSIGRLKSHKTYRYDVALQPKVPGGAPPPPGSFKSP